MKMKKRGLSVNAAATTAVILSLFLCQCLATESDCKFKEKSFLPFKYIASEYICEDPRGFCNKTRYFGNMTEYPMYQYTLQIPVLNETDCLVKFVEPDAQTPITLNQSAPCNDYLVEDEKFPRCFNEWFVNNYTETEYHLYYITNDSRVPNEGQYSLTLNNGKDGNSGSQLNSFVEISTDFSTEFL